MAVLTWTTKNFIINDIIEINNNVKYKKELGTIKETGASEKDIILGLIDEYEGNISMVARKMGISRNTIYKKLRKYKITNKKK